MTRLPRQPFAVCRAATTIAFFAFVALPPSTTAAFVVGPNLPVRSAAFPTAAAAPSSTTPLRALPPVDFSPVSAPPAAATESAAEFLSAATLDPTTALSQALGGLLGSPAILAVPILAAIAVASAVAWFIVSYASPAVEDDE